MTMYVCVCVCVYTHRDIPGPSSYYGSLIQFGYMCPHLRAPFRLPVHSGDF